MEKERRMGKTDMLKAPELIEFAIVATQMPGTLHLCFHSEFKIKATTVWT